MVERAEQPHRLTEISWSKRIETMGMVKDERCEVGFQLLGV